MGIRDPPSNYLNLGLSGGLFTLASVRKRLLVPRGLICSPVAFLGGSLRYLPRSVHDSKRGTRSRRVRAAPSATAAPAVASRWSVSTGCAAPGSAGLGASGVIRTVVGVNYWESTHIVGASPRRGYYRRQELIPKQIRIDLRIDRRHCPRAMCREINAVGNTVTIRLVGPPHCVLG